MAAAWSAGRPSGLAISPGRGEVKVLRLCFLAELINYLFQ